MSPDFPSSALYVLVRVKFENEGPPAGDLDRASNECLAVLATEYLPQRRGADQDVVPVGKVVAAVLPAVIKVGDSRNDDLLGPRSFSDKELAISFACDAKGPVSIGKDRSSWWPAANCLSRDKTAATLGVLKDRTRRPVA